jgi:hypothetical protein
MALVRVWTDVGARKPVPLLAKIVEKDGVIFTIRYLSESDDKIWRYEDDEYEVDDESIAEYLNTENEEDAGFICRGDGFIKADTDEDYIPSDEDEETETETDLDEEDDEDEDEGIETEDLDDEEEEEEEENEF